MANNAKTRKTRATKETKIDNLPVAAERADDVVGGVRKAGETPLEYMKVTLTDLLVSSETPARPGVGGARHA